QPFSGWESLFSTIVPAHIARTYGWVSAFEGFNPSLVISGGPFEIASFEPGRLLVLVRNPRYWYAPAHLSRIVVRVMSPAATDAGLEDGSVTLAELAPGPGVTDVAANAARRGIGLVSANSLLPTLWQLCFNMTDPILSSVPLRQALAASIDRGQVVAESTGLGDWSENADPSRLTLLGQPGAPSPSVQEYNPALAAQLFEAAGYRLDGEGIWRLAATSGSSPPGSSAPLGPVGVEPPLSLSMAVPSGSPELAEAARAIVAELRDAGVEVKVRLLPPAVLLGSVLPEGRYQMALAPFLVTSNVAGVAAVYSTSVLPAASVVHSAGGTGGAGGTGTAPPPSPGPSPTTLPGESSLPEGSTGSPGSGSVSSTTAATSTTTTTTTAPG
ncbi:MAG: ABC transporter substrate-binding protein, partial [Acidimicrobiales bacterium]